MTRTERASAADHAALMDARAAESLALAEKAATDHDRGWHEGRACLAQVAADAFRALAGGRR